MSTNEATNRTLDELLTEARVTRDEWQRARVVVEDYWKDYATLNGWGPLQAERRDIHISIPIRPGNVVTLAIARSLSEEEWESFMEVLNTMKRGLVDGVAP